MTTYRVPVSDPLLARKEAWPKVDGLRLASIGEPGPDGLYYTICTFEDDNAPPELEGKLVQLTLRIDNQTGETTIRDREVIHE